MNDVPQPSPDPQDPTVDELPQPQTGADELVAAPPENVEVGTETAAPADGREDDRTPVIDLDQRASEDPRSRTELYAAMLQCEAERDEYLDDLRRARAEFENYRRRVTREAAQQRQTGVAEAVTALLDVLDDLDRTLEAAATSSDERLAKGVQLVADKLMASLQGLGIERVDALDVDFDPTIHDAVQQLPSDEPVDTPTVAQVLRPGYRLHDRVLRAAMVVVQG